MLWSKTSNLSGIELVKLEKDALAVIDDVATFAKTGFDAIPPADLDRLKWYGLYVQRPKTDKWFMLRVKIPGGILTAPQAETLAGIAKEFGRNRLDLTTRQAIQFHWLAIDVIPEIFTRLSTAGLSTIEAAGDCPRNIIDSPLSGIDPDEVIETSSLVSELNRYFEGNPAFSNLPRKFKIGITGSVNNAIHAEIQDLAFVPAVQVVEGCETIGFNIFVGGGLSASPVLAQQLDVFVRPEEVIQVASAVASLFRDYGYREKRNHARLKFLLADWGVTKFTQELTALTGPLLPSGQNLTRSWNPSPYYGVQRQRQVGLNYLGLVIPGGELTADELADLSHFANQYGDGTLRTTNSQNIILPNIPDTAVSALLSETTVRRLFVPVHSASTSAISCTGKQFCPFGVVETKEWSRQITNYIDQHVELDMPIRVHVSGCVNSCGQNQIADIGLQGTPFQAGGQTQEGFSIWIGGQLGPNARLATKLKGTVPTVRAAEIVTAFLEKYRSERYDQETFARFIDRQGVLWFQQSLDQWLQQNSNSIDPGLKEQPSA